MSQSQSPPRKRVRSSVNTSSASSGSSAAAENSAAGINPADPSTSTHRQSGLVTSSTFLCFLFFEKSLICLEGNSKNPQQHCYFSFLPATPSSLSLFLRCFLSRHGALQGPSNSPCALLLELKKYKDTVWCVRLVSKGPGHHQKQLLQ